MNNSLIACSPLRISIYITSYNQKDYLVEAIESVLNQTVKPFEIIIVDDCSTDGSPEIIQEYAKKHSSLIRPFLHEKKIGVPRNRNFALSKVRGDLVTYVDGDDKFLPRKLELELQTYLKHSEAQIVYSNFRYINDSGEEIAIWDDGIRIPPSGNIFIETYAQDFPRGTPFRSELVSYSCFSDVGFYVDRSFQLYEDWDMRIRLTKRFKVAYCPELLSEYRVHEGSISSLKSNLILKSMFEVYKKNLFLLEKFPKNKKRFIEKKIYIRFASIARKACLKEPNIFKKTFAFKFFIKSFYYYLKEQQIKQAFILITPSWGIVLIKKIYRIFFTNKDK